MARTRSSPAVEERACDVVASLAVVLTGSPCSDDMRLSVSHFFGGGKPSSLLYEDPPVD